MLGGLTKSLLTEQVVVVQQLKHKTFTQEAEVCIPCSTCCYIVDCFIFSVFCHSLVWFGVKQTTSQH